MTAEQLRRYSARASALLKAMSNERRLLILAYLAERERTVGELESLIGISQSALSQHLARLRRDRLVTTRRSAQNIFYSLASAEPQAILASVEEIYAGENGQASPELPVASR